MNNPKYRKIIMCKKEGFAGTCPCPLEESCKEYIREVQNRER
jgi:hypothetical protein